MALGRRLLSMRVEITTTATLLLAVVVVKGSKWWAARRLPDSPLWHQL